MQDTILLAFRKRLKKRGYTNIHIKKDSTKEGDYYICICNEPLSGAVVSVSFPLITYHGLMRF